MVMDPGGTLKLRFKNNRPTGDQLDAFIQATLRAYQNNCGRYCDRCPFKDWEQECEDSKYCPIGIVRDFVTKGEGSSIRLSDQFDMKPVSEQFPEIEFEVSYTPHEFGDRFILSYKDGKIIEGKIGKREMVWYNAVTNQKLM